MFCCFRPDSLRKIGLEMNIKALSSASIIFEPVTNHTLSCLTVAFQIRNKTAAEVLMCIFSPNLVTVPFYKPVRAHPTTITFKIKLKSSLDDELAEVAANLIVSETRGNILSAVVGLDFQSLNSVLP